MLNLIETIMEHMQSYTDILKICGAVVLITLLVYTYLSETNIGALLTLAGMFISVAVCSIGLVCFISLMRADIKADNERIEASIQNSDLIKDAKSLGEMNKELKEEFGFGISDMIVSPFDSLDKTQEKADSLFDEMLGELDKIDAGK